MYGKLPKILSEIKVEGHQMMFYQDLPIKLSGSFYPKVEERLREFGWIIKTAELDFMSTFGVDAYKDCYMYISAKRLYQRPHSPFNREGYHADGFMSDDINYLWSDSCPTIFNNTEFKLTLDDSLSMEEMESQALEQNEITYPDCTLIRVDQYSIHKVAPVLEAGVRTFVKITFSKDKYDLKGNAINYGIKYNWEMRDRSLERNIPQK